MPTAYSPGAVRIELRGTYLNEEVLNTLWVEKVAGPVESADLVNVAIATRNWWVAGMRLLVASSYTLREVYVADWSSDVAPTYTETGTLPQNGANTQPGAPGNVALCVTFRSAGRGRSSRGRNYVCGLTENVLDGNQFTPAVVGAVQAAYEQLLLAYVTAGFEHVVYSQFTNNTLRAVGLASRVVAYSVDLNVDCMRRRLAGRGR